MKTQIYVSWAPGLPGCPEALRILVAHIFVSADAKIHEGRFDGGVGEYFDQLLTAVAGRTKQVHLSVPSGDRANGYRDESLPLQLGDPLSEELLDLTQKVIAESPGSDAFTLEIATGAPDPVRHARKMIEQVELVCSRLDLP